jgi:hypothetical protein
MKYLMPHCSATPEGKDYSEKQIRGWFTARGWNNPGYRMITHLDGSVTQLQPWNSNDEMESWEITNGARSWNRDTIHLCYIGGVEAKQVQGRWVPKDTRTSEQMAALEVQVKFFIQLYPDILVIGHNQVTNLKACPSFYVPTWCREVLKLDEKNIFEKPLGVITPLPLRTSHFLSYDPFDFDHKPNI